ncbi:MAG: SDR family NAD(P)-dependent oxidoreductase [Roseibium sp.]|uniref:SDR family NAD(P)-dependent oxidoreductase n=1 Tax=Roseibium sp. TaxID=1936156 RepID=UPI00263097BD|nr:SDR family NAD(P)-dependent oxidoreductase [Roseibium sp.]MCV0427749.1 SDR family NAD(P)-dependent oxidoreductase [Roseibium sp.]
MRKTILITGSTDGIGLETAKLLRAHGHTVLLHGRSLKKLEAARTELGAIGGDGDIGAYLADFSRLQEVGKLADDVSAQQSKLDVLINNAGILRTPNEVTDDGLDTRFVVNLLAPYILTRKLLPLMDATSRVVNLSSAAQAPVDLHALAGRRRLSVMEAYSQSKLALTMWSRHLANRLGASGPVVIAVNPGSLLASKMVKEGFGVAGSDLGIGAGILVNAALSGEFAEASGRYYDNDSGQFADPHPDGLDEQKSDDLIRTIEALLANRT